MELKFANTNRQVSSNADETIHIEQFYLLNKICNKNACPHATPLCVKYCFGNCVFRHSNKKGSQKLSTEVVAENNYMISKQDDFVDSMNNLIKSKNDSKLYVRIHSIGEFYDYKYFLKWIAIISNNRDVHFTAYIKSFDILSNYFKQGGIIPENFNILLSIFPDTYLSYRDSNTSGIKNTKQLINHLQNQCYAIKYIVCGKEYFINLLKDRVVLHIKNPQQTKDVLFCGTGMKLFKNTEDKIIIEQAKNLGLIIPDCSCNKCKKCYIPSRDTREIYAVMRASSQLANLNQYMDKPGYDFVK